MEILGCFESGKLRCQVQCLDAIFAAALYARSKGSRRHSDATPWFNLP